MAYSRIKDEASSGEAFKALSKKQQELYGCIVRELMNFAQGHSLPMCFAPPLVTATVPLATGRVAVKLPLTLGKVDGASGCVLQLQSGYFFVTAEHVLVEYEKRTREDERLNWQIGRLPPFDPISRIAWRDKTDAYERSQMPYRPTDIVLLRLTKEEAEEACGEARIVPTPVRWPPPPLIIGQHVVMAGYPNQLRAVDLAGTMKREACGLAFQVTNIGDGYCKCQFLYQDVIDFSGAAQPDLKGIHLGGMSGCPVFVLASASEGGLLQYPRLAGVYTHRWGHDATIDIIEIATFEKVSERDFLVSL
jgi:hypothetical protein